MDSQPSQDARVPNGPPEERFYCLYCGYDLSGHSGAERRCPECGRMTTTQELRAAQALLGKPIRAFERPILPSVLFLPVVFFGAPVAIFAARAPVGIILIALLCVLVWIGSIIMFLRKYAQNHDRGCFLLESHFFAILVAFGIQWTLLSALAALFGRGTLAIVLSLTLGILVAVWVWTAVRLYRDMKRRLPAYQLVRAAQALRAAAGDVADGAH